MRSSKRASMSLAESLSLCSGSGDPELPLVADALEAELFAPRSRLKMEGSDADLDVELLGGANVLPEDAEAGMEEVAAGVKEDFSLERSRSQKRWNFERGFGLDASAGSVALRLWCDACWWFATGSGVQRL